MRHPGYLGTILVWLRYGCVSVNWIGIGFIAGVILVAYLYRIRSEEAMLVSNFGEQYRVYRARTPRLVPWVY